MKALDRLLQRWRIHRAAGHIPEAARVLDIGCFDGVLFKRLRRRAISGVGIDPLAPPFECPSYRLIRGTFPQDLPPGRFAVITALAVVEHIDEAQLPALIAACHDRLSPDGRLIITMPSPLVDVILRVLRFLRLLDGMSMEEHHGATPKTVQAAFTTAPDDQEGLFSLVHHERFQLGLNNLLVLEPAAPAARSDGGAWSS